MNPDDVKPIWKAQSSSGRVLVDADRLLVELLRSQRYFGAIIFWRDVREVGFALAAAAVWVYLGVRSSLPWTWFLMVPALVWIAGFLLAARLRYQRLACQPHEPLRQCAKGALAQVEQQIWLLSRVQWWYLLPLAAATMAFVGQGAWEERGGGWWTLLAASGALAVVFIVCAGVYWLNQRAVQAELQPRLEELNALVRSLEDDAPAAG